MQGVIHTNIGELHINLFDKESPSTVTHFCNLVDASFYDNLLFFKHIPNVLIQTGCPDGNGMGDAGFWVKCELDGNVTYEKGSLLMAHAARDANSSQFFICLTDKVARSYRDNNTCFGIVKPESFNLLMKLSKGDSIENISINYFDEENG